MKVYKMRINPLSVSSPTSLLRKDQSARPGIDYSSGELMLRYYGEIDETTLAVVSFRHNDLMFHQNMRRQIFFTSRS